MNMKKIRVFFFMMSLAALASTAAQAQDISKLIGLYHVNAELVARFLQELNIPDVRIIAIDIDEGFHGLEIAGDEDGVNNAARIGLMLDRPAARL